MTQKEKFDKVRDLLQALCREQNVGFIVKNGEIQVMSAEGGDARASMIGVICGVTPGRVLYAYPGDGVTR